MNNPVVRAVGGYRVPDQYLIRFALIRYVFN